MKTKNEISVLSDQALDAVVGGRMKLPHVTDAPQNGAAGSIDGKINGGVSFIVGIAFGIGIGLSVL